MTCPHCQATLPSDAIFCTRCGRPVRGQRQPPPGFGNWDEREFAQPTGNLKVQFYGPSISVEQFPPELARIIIRYIQPLLERLAHEGWYPAEPADPASLWHAGRLELRDELSFFHHQVTISEIRIRCRRWAVGA